MRGTLQRLQLALALSQVLVSSARGQAPAPHDAESPPKRRDAQSVTEDGQVLPGTFAARIGDQRVIALGMSGYDSAESQGAVFSGMVEGAIINRVALRV